MSPIDLGFNGDLGVIATAAAALTKYALYPLAQLRRRVDADGDGQPDDVARGTYFLHPDLQGLAVLVVLAILGVAVAIVAGLGLFPVLSAVFTGGLAARVAHESAQKLLPPKS